MITDPIDRFHSLFKKDIPLFLAPMAGFTDSPFRRICKYTGADVLWSEMVSVEGLIYEKNGKTRYYAYFHEEERPIGIQIFGKDPLLMAEGAKIIEEEFSPDFIDINAGCPVPKVIKKGKGSRLLENPEDLFDIVDKVLTVIKTPLSVKIRLGWKNDNMDEIIKGLNEFPLLMITIHPRTGKQSFTGNADWSRLSDAVKISKIPIVGSGDVKTPEDAVKMIATGVKGIAIARGAVANPWIFGQIKDYIENNEYNSPQLKERIKLFRKHLEYSVEYKGERKTVIEIRKFISGYFHSLPHINQYRRNMIDCDSIECIYGVLKQMEKEYE